MKSKINACLCIMGLFAAIIFSSCANTRHYDFSLKNTLSIFLLNNGKTHYFCMPVQYLGDYHIENFEFSSGYVLIGDYEIALKRNEVNISVYLNEYADEEGNSDGEFNLVYLEEKNRILTSKMDEPLTIKHGSDKKLNYYYIFIEKFIKDDEIRKIANEYKSGNVNSKFYIEYELTIDHEQEGLSGILDDFELHRGPAIAPVWFPPNLDFFKAKYLQ